MPSARYLITLLVTAQLVFYAVGDLAGRVRVGLIDPLLERITGSSQSSFLIGPFDVGYVLGGFISCVVTILLGLLMLRLVYKIAWRWIGPLIPLEPEQQNLRETIRED